MSRTENDRSYKDLYFSLVDQLQDKTMVSVYLAIDDLVSLGKETTNQTIAKKARCSPRIVQECINFLSSNGYIENERVGRGRKITVLK